MCKCFVKKPHALFQEKNFSLAKAASSFFFNRSSRFKKLLLWLQQLISNPKMSIGKLFLDFFPFRANAIRCQNNLKLQFLLLAIILMLDDSLGMLGCSLILQLLKTQFKFLFDVDEVGGIRYLPFLKCNCFLKSELTKFKKESGS